MVKFYMRMDILLKRRLDRNNYSKYNSLHSVLDFRILQRCE